MVCGIWLACFSESRAARQLQFGFNELEAGRTNSVRVELQSQGDENALGFSVQFNPQLMSFNGGRAGADALNATVYFNTNEVAQGRVGIALALPAGESFVSGVRRLVELDFASQSQAAGATAVFSFVDLPIAKEIVDALANTLTTSFQNGSAPIRAPNQPPSISPIADLSILEDSGSHAVEFTIGDDRTALDNLVVTLRSSNTAIVPVPTVRVGAVASARILTLTPASNRFGSSTVTVEVSDGELVQTTTFLVQVEAVNDRPIANAQSVAVIEDIAKAVVLSGNDIEGSALTFSVVANPSKGVLTGTPPNLNYTPNLNQNGSDSFTFKVNDGQLDSTVVTISINIAAVNDAPVANAQTVSAVEDTAKAITLAGSDVEGASLSFIVVAGPAKGNLTGTPPNLTYNPNGHQNGSDSFTFKVNDGQLDSPVATVTIQIAAVNDAPSAQGQTVSAIEDTPKSIVLAGTDIEGSSLTYTVVAGPTKGVLSGVAPNLSYRPNLNFNGSDSFTFKVNDGQLDSAAATVVINVAAVNDPPSISPLPDQVLYIGQLNAPFAFTLGDVDTAAEALGLTLASTDTSVVPLQNITISGNDFARTITVRAADQPGTARVTVTVNDGQGGSASSSFNVVVSRRRVRAIATSAVWGGVLQIPVRLDTEGNENSASFSLSFDARVLTFFNAQLAGGTAGANLTLDSSRAAEGLIGLRFFLPQSQVLGSGSQEIALVRFNVSPTAGTTATWVRLGDAPLSRAAANTAQQGLPLFSEDGLMTLQQGFEADVAPRPNGSLNGGVTIADWVQVGRFAAGLDMPSSPGEFMRADCAPRGATDPLALGNAALTVLDWVQAGRYAAGLDPATPAGGPAGLVLGLNASSAKRVALASDHSEREVRFATETLRIGFTNRVTVELAGHGDENAIGFSIDFDAALLRFVTAQLTQNSGATLHINTNLLAEGRVGFAMAMPVGRSFSAGTNSLVEVVFALDTGTAGAMTTLTFGDRPVVREIGSIEATALAARFESRELRLLGVDLQLSVPQWIEGRLQFGLMGELGRAYSIEATPDWLTWQTLTNGIIAPQLLIIDPMEGSEGLRFYRARYLP
jgi:hypothetical protein